MQLKKQRTRAKSAKEQADITLEIAVLHTESGEHVHALREYKKLLELWQSKGDKFQCAISHRFIADCCIELDDYDQAISHTNQYLKLATELGNKLEQQRAFVTLGRCFLNRAELMKDGDSTKRNLKSAAQALLSSIKMITEFTGELDSKQLGEMRAVSLLNLGQVFRAQRERTGALERFTQCISLARKYQLQKLLFRACYQIADLSINMPPTQKYEPLDRASLISLMNSTSLRNVLTILQMALVSPMAKTNLDHETKELLKSLRESMAQVYLSVGQFRKAAKVYRLLKLHNPNSSDYCRRLIRKCMRLSNLMYAIPESVSSDLDSLRATSKAHEKMGDIYSELEMHGPALRHYQLMLTYAENAFDLCTTAGADKLALTNIVDAALVSVAETYRAMFEFGRCVDTYRREIGWVTSTSLSSADLASSWFSLAQAQRLTCESDSTGRGAQPLLESSTTVDSLNFALQAARSTDNIPLVMEILDELIDYHQEHHNVEQAAQLKQDRISFESIRATSQTSSGRHDKRRRSERTATEGSPVDDDDDEAAPLATGDIDDEGGDDEDAVTEFTETLSSDSEIERCVGQADVLDEFHDGHRGKRQGKALCLRTNMKGETPLHVAAISGDMDHVVKLIEVLAHPVNVTDGAGWLPIHEAAFHDRTEVAIYLLDHGARLDDPGCPLDASTPLFEAIHNGSLATALVLVQRGANLWHRNKQGECLPELLDAWQPVRRISSTFAQQRALFERLLSVIKERLGGDYDRWCNQQRDSSSRKTASRDEVDSSCSEDSADSPRPTDNRKQRKLQSVGRRGASRRGHRRRRPTGSPSLTDQNEDELEERCDSVISSNLSNRRQSRGSRPIRGREWDELLVDLDENSATSDLKPESKTCKSHDTAVKSYREAMEAVGGSASRTNKRPAEDASDAPRRGKRSRAPALIDADDNDWLVNDEAPVANRGLKCPAFVRDQFETIGTRSSERINTVTIRDRRSNEKLRDIGNVGNITVTEFHPSEFVSSTQMVSSKSTRSVKPSANTPKQTKEDPLTVATTSRKQAAVRTVSQTSPKVAIPPPRESAVSTHIKATEPLLPPPASQPITGSSGNTGSHGSHCSVKVAFADISVLVPVDDSSRSVAWLADEAYRRRQILTGRCATSSTNFSGSVGFRGADAVRLSTRDGALLLHTDRLRSVLPVLGQTPGTVIELLAELLHPESGASGSEPLLRPTTVSNSTAASVQPGSGTHVTPAHATNTVTAPLSQDHAGHILPRIVQTRQFKSLLEQARRTGIADLSYLALGDQDCAIICDHLLAQGQLRAITELCLSGNALTTIVPSKTDSMSGILAILVQMAPHLTSLQLAGNFFELNEMLRTLDVLSRHLHPTDDELPVNRILLPRLQQLNISHNTLTASPIHCDDNSFMLEASTGKASTVHWTELIQRFSVVFPKLSKLQLVGCSLDAGQKDTSSTSLSIPGSRVVGPSVSALSDLDLSWNSQLSASSLSTLLSTTSLAGLRALHLRGCSCHIGPLSIPISLPVDQITLASCAWSDHHMDKSVSPMTTRTTNNTTGFSAGDQLVLTLAQVMSKGHFHLQSLDLGYCQLTTHCLDSLRSIFGTPGTSLTTVQLDHNPDLFKSAPTIFPRGSSNSGWIEVIRATAQTASAVASLTIDLPDVDGDDDALSTALAAVEAKLLPGLSSTPLQELVLIGAPDLPEGSELGSATVDAWTLGTERQLSNAERFCQHLVTLFRSRFGTLARVRRVSKGNGVCYGIV
ncbi:hypothetical protein D915_002811 [Fasciola hepatica]|uniref:Uncharacterized protein n=1 Tax=Fasciola hepatica TaxID=6192 RepID=A0A4E0RVD8_FASHE|nr:hypothetical protein D915_002811 [Fasciola hepatica]